MSAQDNLSPAQFFHGSRAQLGVGDMIETGHTYKYGASDPRYVSFTPDAGQAATYARHVNPARGVQDSYDLQPKLYSVEPTGPYEKDPDHYDGTAFRSKKPLRITAVQDVK